MAAALTAAVPALLSLAWLVCLKAPVAREPAEAAWRALILRRLLMLAWSEEARAQALAGLLRACGCALAQDLARCAPRARVGSAAAWVDSAGAVP